VRKKSVRAGRGGLGARPPRPRGPSAPSRRRDARHPYYVQLTASGRATSVTAMRQAIRRFLRAIGSRWTERILVKRIYEVRAETVYDPRHLGGGA